MRLEVVLSHRITWMGVILASVIVSVPGNVTAQGTCEPLGTGADRIQDDVRAQFTLENCDGEPLLSSLVVWRGSANWFTYTSGAAEDGLYRPGGDIHKEVEAWRQTVVEAIELEGGIPTEIAHPGLLWGTAWYPWDNRLALLVGHRAPNHRVIEEIELRPAREGLLVILVDEIDQEYPQVTATFRLPPTTTDGLILSSKQVEELRATREPPADFDPSGVLRAIVSSNPIGRGFLRR